MAGPKVSVTITYQNSNTQPPLYVAGTFSDPQWVPELMEHKTGGNGQHTYTKEVQVEPGSELQYKFRLGESDWWVLDEDKPTVTDNMGNRNNVIGAPPLEEHAPPTAATADRKLEPQNLLQEENGPKKNMTKEETPKEKPENEKPENSQHVDKQADEEATTPPDKPKLSAVQSLKEEVPRSQTSTPNFIRTAAEVADSAALLDKEEPESEKPQNKQEADEEAKVLPEPKLPVLQDLKNEVSRSQTSTPDFIRTAAEVADSAALLDKEEPEPEISDELAGQLGVRRLSSTPIPEVAKTAAEVADTAMTLDTNEPEIRLRKPPPVLETAGAWDDAKDDSLDLTGNVADSDPAPLFAHECAGLYENEEVAGAPEVATHAEVSSNEPDEPVQTNFDDPTLERFPSSKEEVKNALRKVETGRNEDQTAFEGVPPSPVVGSRQNNVADVHHLHLSPASSPAQTRGPQHLGVPKKTSRASLGERSLSALSLGSIEETEEVADENKPKDSAAKDIAPVVEQVATAEEAIKVAEEAEGHASLNGAKPSLDPITIPSPSVKPVTLPRYPASDEDEAVVISDGKGKQAAETGDSGYLTPERAGTPKPEEPGSPREPPPNTAPPAVEVDVDESTSANATSEAAAATTVPEGAEPRSPRIVVHTPEEDDPEELSRVQLSRDGVEEVHDAAACPGEQDGATPSEGTDVARSTALDEALPGTGTLKRRGAPFSPTERAATPQSITDAGRDLARKGDWFKAFFRLVFIDWIGGFVNKLCGGRRKT